MNVLKYITYAFSGETCITTAKGRTREESRRICREVVALKKRLGKVAGRVVYQTKKAK